MESFTYINGDKAIYTGKSEVLYGDVCHEVEIVEGHRKGEKASTYRLPGSVGNYNSAMS
jgi:hypothetical protein